MSNEVPMLIACSLLAAASACIEDAGGEIQERAITQAEIGRIIASKTFQENADLLERQGEAVALGEGEIWTEPAQDISAAVFPVHPVQRGQRLGEFAYLIVDLDASGEVVEATLELTPGFTRVHNPNLPTEPVSLCQQWGPWEAVSGRCDDWSWWCWGEADVALSERSRTCVVDGESWVETEQARIRHACGC